MELELTRDTLRFERFVTRGEEQVTIEGEATLPGSMRDAVTVLNVQAQAHLTDMQSGREEAGVRGRVCFQVMYTQGDLTRIRTLETTCDFTHTCPIVGAAPGMRLSGTAIVQETEGIAGSGRITLRALLEIRMEAFETAERELITGVSAKEADIGLQVRSQEIVWCIRETLGQECTAVREEFDLPQRLGVGDVVSATATASAGEIAGGNGRVGVSGVVEVRVLHRPAQAGNALVMTTHEMPYELSVSAQLPDGAQPIVSAEVLDIMADLTESDKARILRVEAEIRVTLSLCLQRQATLLEDLYSLNGPVLEPITDTLDIHTFEETADVRESVRLQTTLPADAPPIGTMLAAFAQPTIASLHPAGRRLDAEGVMNVTLIYLPMDSDIPYAVHAREPFAMTFPVEAGEDVTGYAQVIDTTPGSTTSDRAEIRCVLALHAVQHGTQRIRVVTDLEQRPEERREHGFVLVWPRDGETKWDIARRLRVDEKSLHAVGERVLLALRR